MWRTSQIAIMNGEIEEIHFTFTFRVSFQVVVIKNNALTCIPGFYWSFPLFPPSQSPGSCHCDPHSEASAVHSQFPGFESPGLTHIGENAASGGIETGPTVLLS